MDGDLVGVTTAYFDGGQGLNFAVPSKYVAQLLAGTKERREVAELTESETSERKTLPSEIFGGKRYELTDVDITTIDDFHSTKASILGIYLGMSRASFERLMAQSYMSGFKSKLETHKLPIYMYIPNYEPTVGTIYVYRKDSDQRVLSLSLDLPNGPITTIRVFDNAAYLLVGNTKNLLTANAVQDNSILVQNFLGPQTDTKFWEHEYTEEKYDASSVAYFHETRGIVIEEIRYDYEDPTKEDSKVHHLKLVEKLE